MKNVLLNNITGTLEAGNWHPFDLSSASNYSAISYIPKFEVKHDNAEDLTCTDFEFISNIVDTLNLEVNAGNKVLDLKVRGHLLIHLFTRGCLDIDIDRTAGEGKVSTFHICLDMALFNFQNPKEGYFHTWSYNKKTINILTANYKNIDNLTVEKVSILIEEDIKTDSKPIYYAGTDKQVALFKKPIPENKPIVGKEEITFKFPTDKTVTGIIVYATNSDGKIVDDCIDTLELYHPSRAGHSKRTLKDIVRTAKNGRMFLNYDEPHAKNIAFLNIAKGQISEGINTRNINYKDQQLKVNVSKQGYESPILNVIFLTVGELNS